MKKRVSSGLLLLLWTGFILSLVFLIDVKHTRYKIIGMELALLGISAVWTWRNLGDIRDRLKDRLLVPLAVLAAGFSLFHIFSPVRSVSFVQWQRILFSCIAFFAAYSAFPGKGSRFLLAILTGSGGLLGIYGIMQKTGGFGPLQVPEMARVFGTFGNPNFFASFLAGLIPVAGAYFLEKKRIWIAVSVLVMSVALFYTYSRGAWLGLIGAAVLWWLVWGRKKVPAITVLALAALIALFVFINRHSILRSTERLLIWRDTVRMGIDNFFTGTGLGQFYSRFPEYASARLKTILPPGRFIVNYAHNEFLEIFAETGIIGLGIYLWFLAAAVYRVIKSKISNHVSRGFFLGSAAVFIHSLVSVNMRFGVSSIWAFMLLGLTFGWEREENAVSSGRPGFRSIMVMASVLAVAVILGKKTIDPLISYSRLKTEKSFFKQPEEYSEKKLLNEIKDNTEDAMAYYRLGWIYAKRHDFDRAVKYFRKTVELDPARSGAYNNLGNIYYSRGDRKTAAAYYIKAIEIDPGLKDAHFNLGYIFYHQGRLKEAVREFKAVLELDPDNYKAKVMLEKMVQ